MLLPRLLVVLCRGLGRQRRRRQIRRTSMPYGSGFLNRLQPAFRDVRGLQYAGGVFFGLLAE